MKTIKEETCMLFQNCLNTANCLQNCILKINVICIIICLHVYMCATCMPHAVRSHKRSVGFLGPRVRDSYDFLHR